MIQFFFQKIKSEALNRKCIEAMQYTVSRNKTCFKKFKDFGTPRTTENFPLQMNECCKYNVNRCVPTMQIFFELTFMDILAMPAYLWPSGG